MKKPSDHDEYELPDEYDFAGKPATRGRFYSPKKVPVTIRLGVCRIQAASNPYAGKSQPIGETRTRYSRKFRVNRAKGDVCCPHLTAKRDQSDRLLDDDVVRYFEKLAGIKKVEYQSLINDALRDRLNRQL